MQKTYLGNGKVVWVSDGKIEVAEREETKDFSSAIPKLKDEDNGLPF